jgi:transposase
LGKKGGFGYNIRSLKKKCGDQETHMIDGSIIRAHRHAAGGKQGQDIEELGRSCGGFSSKIHAKVDGNGMPLEIVITKGQDSDIGQAERLIKGEKCVNMLADRGYDSDALRVKLKEQGINSVIPGRKNRKEAIVYDEELYKRRNAIERFFGRIKEFRRVATRYDKTSAMYKGTVVLASICLWLKV